MGVNKFASTFPMASCNTKMGNHRRKKCGVKNMKIRNCFSKYAIEDNQLRKYPIDPKAYLGRCIYI